MKARAAAPGGGTGDRTKAALVALLADVLRRRALTRTQAARRCRTDPPTLAQVLRGRLARVSLDRLVHWLAALGYDVEIRIAPGAGDAGSITVRSSAAGAAGDSARAEAAWRESEDRYRTLLETSPDAVHVHRNGIIILANQEAAALFGAASPEDLIGREALALVDPASLPLAQARTARLTVPGQRNPPTELTLRRLDGRRVVAEAASATVLLDGQLAVQAVLRDVTARRRAEAALRESEARYRATQEHANVGIGEVDAGGRFLRVNAALCAITGYTEDELLARTLFDITHPDDAWVERAEYARLVAGAIATYAREKRYRRQDGTERWVEVAASAVRDPAGRFLYGVRVVQDVTERKRAEAALRDSEARYRTLFDSIDEGFCIIEFVDGEHGPLSDYRYIEANPALEAQSGMVGVVGKTVREVLPDEAQEWIDIFGKVLRTGDPIRFERVLAASDRFLELFAFRVEPESRRQVAVIFQDVTARRRAEDALRRLNDGLERRVAEALAERKVLADIVEGTDAFVQVADLGFRWLAINKASADEFERIFGVRPKVGASMLDILADRPEHQAAVRAVWSRALAGEEFTEIGEFGDPAIDRRFYEMKYNTLRDRDGNRIGAYQFVHDVTQRLRNQERLAQAEEALRQAQKMEAIGQLTGGVAHDFNNLLQAIASGLQLLDRRDDPELRRRVLDSMRQAVERGARLTRQLLTFSRRQPLHPEPVDVARQVGGIRELLARSLRGDLQLEMSLSPATWPVEVDPGELELVMLNLCVNARDAMPEGGTIAVTAENAPDLMQGNTCGDFVRLSVQDTGIGIPAEIRARVFEPFFTTKEVGKGSGLGLAQVYGFAKQSGGSVEIDSEVGRGTSVTLLLPRSRKQPAAIEAPPVATAEPRPGGDGALQGQVLLVEDDEEVAALATEMLGTMGFNVTRVASAAAALGALADGRPIDIVFSDIMMPGGISGLELAREVKRRRPGLPVVLTTGYETAAAGAEAEGIGLLLKPYRVEALAETLRAHLTHEDGRGGGGVAAQGIVNLLAEDREGWDAAGVTRQRRRR